MVSARERTMTTSGSGGERQTRGEYNRRHGGRYDSDEDRSRSPTPDPWGQRAFGVNVVNIVPPTCYQPTTMVAKYDGETNPSVWLEVYRLTYHNGGVRDDLFIIKSISLYLVDSVRT